MIKIKLINSSTFRQFLDPFRIKLSSQVYDQFDPFSESFGYWFYPRLWSAYFCDLIAEQINMYLFEENMNETNHKYQNNS